MAYGGFDPFGGHPGGFPGVPPWSPYLQQQQQLRIPQDPSEALKLIHGLREEGNTLFREGRYSVATMRYESALSICEAHGFETNAVILHSNAAAVYLKLNDFEAAGDHAEQCIALDPDFVKGYYRRAEACKIQGLALQGAGRLRNATTTFQRAIQDYVECYKQSRDVDSLCQAIELAVDWKCTSQLKLPQLNIQPAELANLLHKLICKPDTKCKHLKFLLIYAPRVPGSGFASQVAVDLSDVNCSPLFNKSDFDVETMKAVLSLGATITPRDIKKAVGIFSERYLEVLKCSTSACRLQQSDLDSLCEIALAAKKPQFVAHFLSCGAKPDLAEVRKVLNWKDTDNLESLFLYVAEQSESERSKLVVQAIKHNCYSLASKLLSAGAVACDQIDLGKLIASTSLASNPKMFQQLLEAGISPNGTSGGTVPLDAVLSLKRYATERKVTLICSLVEKGANLEYVSTPRQEGTTIIHKMTDYALETGEVHVLEMVCSKFNFPENGRITNKRGQTPFHIAMRAKQNETSKSVCAVLSQFPINPEVADRSGKMPTDGKSKNDKRIQILQEATERFKCSKSLEKPHKTMDILTFAQKGSLQSVCDVLEAGIPVDTTNEYGNTALMWASANGHVNVVEKLLAAGANLNHQDKYGTTALMWASYGHGNVVEKLLAAGADPNHQNKDGLTALMWASLRGHDDVVEKLLAIGADPNHQAKYGNTALICASENGHVNVVEKLLAAGADPNHQDNEGRTVLILASQNEDTNVVEKLLAAGADPNHQDSYSQTAVIRASLNGHVNVVAKLLAAGADPNHQTKEGMTALHWASEVGHVNVVRMLQAAGAQQKGHVVTKEWMKVHTNGRVQHEASTDIDGDYFYFKEGSTGVIKILEPMNPQLNYYEYLIVNRGQEASVGIGVGERNYPMNHMPGWNPNSCGYHADDGNLFDGSLMGCRLGPTCTDGDRMGCGVDFSAGSSSGYVNVFFTKNGKQVGDVVRMKKPEHGLYPLIGLANRGEKVKYLGHSHRVPGKSKESTKQDFSCADSVGHPLSAKELLVLKDYILPEDVIESLQQEGLDLNTIAIVQTTIEEVQRRLDSLGQSELASSLRQRLDFALEKQSHYEVYKQALEEGAAIPLKYLKVLFFGPPRTGKTSMRRRLVGEIQNLANEPVQASTGTAEVHEVIVKKVTISTAVIKKSSKNTETTTEYKWSSVKVLCGKEKRNHDTDLDEELQILYQFICGTVEKSSHVPDEEGPQEHTAKRQKPSLARVEKESPTQGDLPPKTDNQVASDSPEVLSVEEQGDGLSPKQLEEIEEAIEAFNKILRTAGQQQLGGLLEDWLDRTILMNMVDTGGQPAFLEMLPALTIGPALYLIFFRLDQELKQNYEVKYGRDSKNISLDDSYTNEQVIFQALSSIACFNCTTPIIEGVPNPSHAAVLIGTYKDQLGSDPKTKIKEKDEKLKKTLSEILKCDLRSNQKFLKSYSEDQLMFAVDNMNGGVEELTKVHKRLEKLIQQMYKLDNKWKIPASWLMFSIFIRKMNKHTLSLSQCHEIGSRLSVRDTNEALWFLHHCVGILMHFSDIPEIKDIVICDPQVVFDSVTVLIMDSFTFDNMEERAEKFKKTGQFRYTDIENVAIDQKRDSLSPQQLVGLLEHLNIIAPFRCYLPQPNALTPELSAQSDAHQEKIYFMPAVLKHAKEEELRMEQSSTDLVPLIVRFTCGFVPVGVFCAMIASLVAQEDTLGWELLEPSEHNDYILCKNKVTFRMYCTYDITLVSRPKWYEIHVICDRESTPFTTLEQVSQEVLDTVCDTLDKVISKMRYKHLTSFHSKETLYELGFKCPKHPADDHLVINRPMPMKGLKATSQSAKFLWLNYFEKKSIMFCLGKGIAVALPSSSRYLGWFEKCTKMSLVPSVSKLGVQPQAGHPYQSSYLSHQSLPHGAGVTPQLGYSYQSESNQPLPHGTGVQPQPGHPYLSYLSHQPPPHGTGPQPGYSYHAQSNQPLLHGTVATDQVSFSSSGAPTYPGYDTPDMPTFVAPQFPQPSKMELNDRNILNVLHKAKFADAHWELLGMQLITHSALCNIRANRNGQANLCMIDTIVQWLSTDAAKSWEKLAEAIAKVEGYGEVTVDAVRQEAGIAHAVTSLSGVG